jgi:hypothetical protein
MPSWTPPPSQPVNPNEPNTRQALNKTRFI